jgi:hypothetical protein
MASENQNGKAHEVTPNQAGPGGYAGYENPLTWWEFYFGPGEERTPFRWKEMCLR